MLKKLIPLALLTAAAALGAGYFWLSCQEDGAGKSHGFIDLRETSLSFEISGRIASLHADEGEEVAKGQILASLDTSDLKEQLLVQEASCAVLKAQLDKLIEGYRPELKAQAKAEAERLYAQLQLREAAAARTESLYAKKAVSAQERDDAVYARDSARAALEAQQALLLQYQNGYERSDIEISKLDLQQCRAREQYLHFQIDAQSVLRAPYAGVLRSRLQELGDMTSPQTPVFYLSNVYQKKVRFYLNELQLKDVAPGDEVQVLNAAGSRRSAVVSAISDSAMFTPKSVQTEDLRPELVYEVTALMEDERREFRLGQAVTVYYQNKDGLQSAR